jgi:hypothetical protein
MTYRSLALFSICSPLHSQTLAPTRYCSLPPDTVLLWPATTDTVVVARWRNGAWDPDDENTRSLPQTETDVNALLSGNGSASARFQNSPFVLSCPPVEVVALQNPSQPVRIMVASSNSVFVVELTGEVQLNAIRGEIVRLAGQNASGWFPSKIPGAKDSEAWKKLATLASTWDTPQVITFKGARAGSILERSVDARQWEALVREHSGLPPAPTNEHEVPVLQGPSAQTNSGPKIPVPFGTGLGVGAVFGCALTWLIAKKLRPESKPSITARSTDMSRASPRQSTLFRPDLPTQASLPSPQAGNELAESATLIFDELHATASEALRHRSDAESKLILQAFEYARESYRSAWKESVSATSRNQGMMASLRGLVLKELGVENIGAGKIQISLGRKIQDAWQKCRALQTAQATSSVDAFIESLPRMFKDAAKLPRAEQRAEANRKKAEEYDRLESKAQELRRQLDDGLGKNEELTKSVNGLRGQAAVLDRVAKLQPLSDRLSAATRALFDVSSNNPEVASAAAVLIQRAINGMVFAVAQQDDSSERMHGSNLRRLCGAAANKKLEYFGAELSDLGDYDPEFHIKAEGVSPDKYFIERLLKTVRDYLGLNFEYDLGGEPPQQKKLTMRQD